MKTNKLAKIEAVASVDSSRYVLTEPYLDTENKRILCTDRRAMVFLPVEVSPEDVSGHLPVSALKHARKVDSKRPEGISVKLSATHAQTSDSTQFPRTDQQHAYPVKASDQILKSAQDNETVCEFSLDVSLLFKIAQAFGGDAVKIQVKAKGNALVIFPTFTKDSPIVSPGAVALLMQILTEKK